MVARGRVGEAGTALGGWVGVGMVVDHGTSVYDTGAGNVVGGDAGATPVGDDVLGGCFSSEGA